MYTAVYSSGPKADFDGDNAVTEKDAILLLQYIHFGNSVEIKHIVDLDGDGKITSDDAIYLKKHLSDSVTYPIE